MHVSINSARIKMVHTLCASISVPCFGHRLTNHIAIFIIFGPLIRPNLYLNCFIDSIFLSGTYCSELSSLLLWYYDLILLKTVFSLPNMRQPNLITTLVFFYFHKQKWTSTNNQYFSHSVTSPTWTNLNI